MGRLPIEVVGNVLASLDSPGDLAACLKASPVFWNAYKENLRAITFDVIRNAFCNENELNAALAIVAAPGASNFKDMDVWAVLGRTSLYLAKFATGGFGQDASLLNMDFLTANRAALFRLHRVVTFFSNDYCHRGLGQHSPRCFDINPMIDRLAAVNREGAIRQEIQHPVAVSAVRRYFLIYELFARVFNNNLLSVPEQNRMIFEKSIMEAVVQDAPSTPGDDDGSDHAGVRQHHTHFTQSDWEKLSLIMDYFHLIDVGRQFAGLLRLGTVPIVPDCVAQVAHHRQHHVSLYQGREMRRYTCQWLYMYDELMGDARRFDLPPSPTNWRLGPALFDPERSSFVAKAWLKGAPLWRLHEGNRYAPVHIKFAPLGRLLFPEFHRENWRHPPLNGSYDRFRAWRWPGSPDAATPVHFPFPYPPEERWVYPQIPYLSRSPEQWAFWLKDWKSAQ